MEAQGWIKLHRKLQHNFLWTEPRKFSKAEAWIDLLMEARHDDTPAKVLLGNTIIECGKGQSVKSLDTWAHRWRWSKASVRRFLSLLQTASQIRHESVTKSTRITICNYESYQESRNAKETQVKRRRNASETQVAPNKNEENEENEKKGGVAAPGEPEQRPAKRKTFKQWNREDLIEAMKDVNTDGLLTADECEEFADYWMEPSATGRSRMSLERTWGTRRRMQTALRMIYEKQRVEGGTTNDAADREGKEANKAMANAIWDIKDRGGDNAEISRAITTMRNKWQIKRTPDKSDAISRGVDLAMNNNRAV